MSQNLRFAWRKVRALSANRSIGIIMLALFMTVVIAVLSGSVNNVSILDGETRYTVKSADTDPARLLALADISYSEHDEVVTTRFGKEILISIDRAEPVHITVGDLTRTLYLTSGTVADAVEAAGVTLSENDIVNYPLDTPLTKDMQIDIVAIRYVTETVQETIPFEATTVYSNQYAKGKKVTTDGKSGTKEVTYQKTIVNGEVTETKVVKETVLAAAVDAKTIIGTKVEQTSSSSQSANASTATQNSNAVQTISAMKPNTPIQLDKNGNPVNYKSHMTVQATAYTYVSGSPNICATGVKAQTGYIAVNPKVIPYGTKMYIKSSDGKFIYGYAIAADTGGFVKTNPTNVDLFLNTYDECAQFGRRNVEIWILE